jgi:hypothetical protein
MKIREFTPLNCFLPHWDYLLCCINLKNHYNQRKVVNSYPSTPLFCISSQEKTKRGGRLFIKGGPGWLLKTVFAYPRLT